VIDGQLLAFAGVALVLSLTPGPDMALVLRNTLRDGRPAGFCTVGGIALGLLVWATMSALGVAAVLAASATVFTVLKLAGAAYSPFGRSGAAKSGSRRRSPQARRSARAS
jgi:threonine/homoserine/homoserine lactone efflux protein